MSFPAPSVVAPDLDDFQLQYAGLTMGAGTSYPYLELQGVDLAKIRSGDAGRPLDQGEFIGWDLYGGRDITVSYWIAADGGSSLQALLAPFRAATVIGGVIEQPLWIKLPGTPLLVCSVRARKRTLNVDVNYGAAQLAKPVVQFHATDPRFYSTPTQTQAVGLAQPGAGLTFPVTFPVTFGQSGGSATIQAVNSGDTEVRPILVIAGPVTNPWVSNGSLPGAPILQFSNPFQNGYTVPAGDTLTVDLDWQTISYQTAGSTQSSQVPDWLVYGSTWWNLPPGTNSISWGSSDSAATGATLTVQWASGYASAT